MTTEITKIEFICPWMQKQFDQWVLGKGYHVLSWDVGKDEYL